jgi:radical SAM superfamily enzyme YgiQ (UPF0313 family)
MKVALIQPPVWWTLDPPIGLAQVAGCAKSRGHEVSVFDLNMQLWKRRGESYAGLWDWEQYDHWNDPLFVAGFFRENAAYIEEFLSGVLRTDAKVIGFSVYRGGQVATLLLARMIKAQDPRRVVVLGGQYFFKGDKAAEMLADLAVDAVISGPGDESFPALLAAVEATGRPQPAPGVAVRTARGVVDGGAPVPIRDLDVTPFADYTGFPMELYTFEPRIPMNASRGCIWYCRFCSTREFWPGYSYMSGARIYAELEHQKKIFPHMKHFEFYDITFNGNIKSVQDLAGLLAARGPRDPQGWYGFKVNAVLRPEMTPELLGKLRLNGLVDVIYGVESGSPRVLGLMNKNFTIDTAERVLRDTHEAGIKTTGNFMFGFPGETEDDFAMTLDFLRRNSRSLDRAYASATFTSLEEFSYLTDNKPEFEIKDSGNSLHNLYWETKDGTNTYLIRQDRYERFRKLAISLGIDAYKGVNGTVEQDRRNNLAQYHHYTGDHFESIKNLLASLELDFYSEPNREQLAAYRRDLGLLLRALRVARNVNGVIARKGPSAPPLERRIAAARTALSSMRDCAELKIHEGVYSVKWGKTEAVDPKDAALFHERAGLFLDIAAAEILSGESQRKAPECAR